jgi:hypothetical protein
MDTLTLRKLADKESVERVARFDPMTGAKFMVDPATGEPSPWPLLGLAAPDGWPRKTRVPVKTITRGIVEGWAELVNPQMVFRPGGPPEEPYRVTHAFTHADEIIFKGVNGNVRYKVTQQPDKYAARNRKVLSSRKGLSLPVIERDKLVTPDLYLAGQTEVTWYYELEAVHGVLKAGAEVQASDFVFNRAKGRGTQWTEEIRASVSPYTNSALIISLWRRGSAVDASLKDYDDVAALEGDAQAAELVSGTNANYARKTLIDTTPTVTYDDTNEWVDIDYPDQTWTALGAGGTAITDYLNAFDNDTTAGTDANQVPWTFHAFSVTPDGSDVTAVLPTGGFFRAQ